MDEDIDIRPVLVDKLVEFTDIALTQRCDRLSVLVEEYQQKIATQEEALEKTKSLFRFLKDEHEKATLAVALKNGDVVRVVCPTCQGSGFKAVDVTSGRIQRKSAFERIGSEAPKQLSPVDVDPSERCTHCKGNRWVLMDRFKG